MLVAHLEQLPEAVNLGGIRGARGGLGLRRQKPIHCNCRWGLHWREARWARAA